MARTQDRLAAQMDLAWWCHPDVQRDRTLFRRVIEARHPSSFTQHNHAVRRITEDDVIARAGQQTPYNGRLSTRAQQSKGGIGRSHAKKREAGALIPRETRNA